METFPKSSNFQSKQVPLPSNSAAMTSAVYHQHGKRTITPPTKESLARAKRQFQANVTPGLGSCQERKQKVPKLVVSLVAFQVCYWVPRCHNMYFAHDWTCYFSPPTQPLLLSWVSTPVLQARSHQPASSSFRLACSLEQFTRLFSSPPNGSCLPSSFWLQPNQHCQMSCKINFLLGSFPWCEIPLPFLSNLLSCKPGSVSLNHTCPFHKDKETKTPLHTLGGKDWPQTRAAGSLSLPRGLCWECLAAPRQSLPPFLPQLSPCPREKELVQLQKRWWESGTALDHLNRTKLGQWVTAAQQCGRGNRAPKTTKPCSTAHCKESRAQGLPEAGHQTNLQQLQHIQYRTVTQSTSVLPGHQHRPRISHLRCLTVPPVSPPQSTPR